MAATLALIPGLERLLTLSQGRNFVYFGVGQVGRPSGAAGGVQGGDAFGRTLRERPPERRAQW